MMDFKNRLFQMNGFVGQNEFLWLVFGTYNYSQIFQLEKHVTKKRKRKEEEEE
jgi:hypothetical protein